MSNAPEPTTSGTEPMLDFDVPTDETQSQVFDPAPAPAAEDAVPVREYVPADEPVQAAPEKDEIARLLDDPSVPLSLGSGTTFQIRQLRLREMLRLLRIVSVGGSSMMGSMDFDTSDTNAFVQNFVALVIFSIPEAEDETVDFLQSMVMAVPTGDPKVDADANLALVRELANPDLEDAISIITAIVASEGNDLAALGKRLRSLMGVARKVGQVPENLRPVVG